jgi:hypothetical protein
MAFHVPQGAGLKLITRDIMSLSKNVLPTSLLVFIELTMKNQQASN